MNRKLIIIGLLVLIIVGLLLLNRPGAEKEKRYRCPDGRQVSSPQQCHAVEVSTTQGASHDLTQNKSGLATVGTTIAIDGVDEVETAFNAYVREEGLDYTFSSAEVYQKKDGITYYAVIYRHSEISGGRDMLIIDSRGRVYRQEMLI